MTDSRPLGELDGPRVRSMAAHCITGDDTGLVKRVGLSQGQELHRWGVQAAGVGVCRLSWGAGDDEGVCGAGMQTGAVRFWDTGTDADSATYSATCEYAAPAGSTPAAVVGLRAVGTRVVACDANAHVRVWQWAAPTRGGCAADAPLLSFQAGKRAAAAAVADDGARLAAGGREADLTVWDLERGESSFKARNLPNDNLDLAVPIWTTDVQWVPQQPNQLLTSTGFVQFRLRGEVRLYDVSAGRRPQARAVAPLGEESLSAIGCTPDGRYVIAGSVSGGICRLDLRKNLQAHTASRYKGAAGSVRQIAVHRSAGLIACAGLDRMVRVYDAEAGDIRHKVYLKHRLTALLLSAEVDAPAAAADGDDDVGHMLAQLPEAQPEAEEAEEAGVADAPLNVSVTFDGVAADDDTDDDGQDEADAADAGGDDAGEYGGEEEPPPRAAGRPKRGDRPAAPAQPSRKREAQPTGAQKTTTTATKKKKKKP
jgi:ribosome biogenesis protein NSA1